MIDVHAHLCFPEFDRDREEIIARCKKELTAVVLATARYGECVEALKTAGMHKDFLFPTLGYHPTEGSDYEKVLDLIKRNKDRIAGIGEVGLDYHWEKDLQKQERQKEIFSQFIDLAEKLKLPLVIHSWEAERDCFEMVKGKEINIIFHCYSGPVDLAREIIQHENMWISISTNICFSKQLRKVAKMLPLDRLLLETDSPFLDPDRERKRNTPWNIKLSAEKIEKETGTPKEKVLGAARQNAIRAFRLKL
ncbi:MAG: TatD family hydrolase [Candidatus Aenigmarchaeota archaeon]|nr:TatD family hydrolase [Candidatus Aenigmarchaeota archaeon]